MNSERGGLLKARAEDFARHLQTRLRSLREGDNISWSSTDSEVYYDIDSSLASPQEELTEPIFIAAQNQNSFPLQRDGSSDSQYFDTVENVDDLSPENPVPPLKKIPILHLKTDTKASDVKNEHKSNGHLPDVDAGCSRVCEMPSVDVKQVDSEIGNNDINCDLNVLEENNNTGKECEDEIEHVTVNCESVRIEENGLSEGEESIDLEEDDTEIVTEPSCVFCDIDKIKSSLSNGTLENGTLQDHHDNINSHCEEKELEKVTDKSCVIGSLTLKPSSPCSPDAEENVTLVELLQVLKQDIENKIEEKKDEIECKSDEIKVLVGESAESSQVVCPEIELREPSPCIGSDSNSKEEEEDIETKRKGFRRCSSLRSGKTPPSTPGRKKIVRFADVLGLDLADVKTFMDEVPTVPRSAFEDLHNVDLSTPVIETFSNRIMVVTALQPVKVVIPLFQQPSVQPNFLDRVRENNVCLESAYVSDAAFSAITGVVRVKNIDFHKSVYVRYSIDHWKSFSDLQARYVPNSCDGFSDKFNFTLYAHTLSVGQRLEFCIRYHTAGTQFWDSNGSRNYVFECVSQQPSDSSVPPSQMETCASFY